MGERKNRRPTGAESHHLVRLQEHLPGTGACCGPAAVTAHAPRPARSGDAGDQLGRGRDHLPVGDQQAEVSDHLLGQGLAPGAPQVGQLLGAEHEADAGRAGAAEQPDDVLGGDGRELVDQNERPDRAGLRRGDDGLQVLHDGRGEHLAEQRPAVRAQREQHHRALPGTRQQVHLRGPSGRRLQPGSGVGLRQHRQAIPHPGEVGPLTGSERVEVGERGPRVLGGKLTETLLEVRRIEVVDQRGERDLLAREPQRADLVSEVALGLTEVVGLGKALGAERLVGDLRLGAAGERVVDARALGRPLEEPPAAGAGGCGSAARAERRPPSGRSRSRPCRR